MSGQDKGETKLIRRAEGKDLRGQTMGTIIHVDIELTKK